MLHRQTKSCFFFSDCSGNASVRKRIEFQDHVISLGIPWIACFQEIDTNFILIKKYNKANKQYSS